MAKRIVNRTVSFNVCDPLQDKLYKHAISSSTNFSGYIKTLIQRDLDGVVINKAPAVNVEEIDKALLNSLI